jgi:uncharacterized protein HemX
MKKKQGKTKKKKSAYRELLDDLKSMISKYFKENKNASKSKKTKIREVQG